MTTQPESVEEKVARLLAGNTYVEEFCKSRPDEEDFRQCLAREFIARKKGYSLFRELCGRYLSSNNPEEKLQMCCDYWSLVLDFN